MKLINILAKLCSINSLIDSIINISELIVKKTSNKIDDFLLSLIKLGFQMQRNGASLKEISMKLLIVIIKDTVNAADNKLDQHDADQIMKILNEKGLLEFLKLK